MRAFFVPALRPKSLYLEPCPPARTLQDRITITTFPHITQGLPY